MDLVEEFVVSEFNWFSVYVCLMSFGVYVLESRMEIVFSLLEIGCFFLCIIILVIVVLKFSGV